MAGLCIPPMRGTPGTPLFWCLLFSGLHQIEAELDVDNYCEENLYPTVIAWLVYVCNKNLLSFGGIILTLGG